MLWGYFSVKPLESVKPIPITDEDVEHVREVFSQKPYSKPPFVKYLHGKPTPKLSLMDYFFGRKPDVPINPIERKIPFVRDPLPAGFKELEEVGYVSVHIRVDDCIAWNARGERLEEVAEALVSIGLPDIRGDKA